MANTVPRLLMCQALLVAAASALFHVRYGAFSALSVCGGGLIAAANILLLRRCMQREAHKANVSAQHTLAAVYVCALQRFIVVALLFAMGMGILKLDPLALLVGFIAGQSLLFLSATRALIAK